jgi:hypothetical protein
MFLGKSTANAFVNFQHTRLRCRILYLSAFINPLKRLSVLKTLYQLLHF